jgi:hypothetical protein
MFSHLFQHRGHFSVYLGLLKIAVPSSREPRAIALPTFMQQAAQRT